MRSRFRRGSILALYVAPLLYVATDAVTSPSEVCVVPVAMEVLRLPSSGTYNGGS